VKLTGLDRRPLLVILAGPNGAGKTTFYRAHLAAAGLRFVNADVLAEDLGLDAAAAAKAARALAGALLQRRESFVFETVFSDPVGQKLGWLADVEADGYTTLLCYIGLSSARVSEERVAMRVSQGGHDVSSRKLQSRYRRSLTNLRRALRQGARVVVYDNGDLRFPFQFVAAFERGRCVERARRLPPWFARLLR
jgi:predicted ABC-type ATPase